MEYQEKSTLSSPDDTMLPEVYTDTVACIYNVDGKCKGMLIPERLHILQKAFDKAKCSSLHGHIKPPPISFASKLVGLLLVKTSLPLNIRTKKPKILSLGYSPPTSPPFKSGPWTLKKKWHPPLTTTPSSPITGVSTQGRKCLGQTPMPSPPDFLGSPSTMKHHALSNEYAIYSAAVSTEETATFMLLPS